MNIIAILIGWSVMLAGAFFLVGLIIVSTWFFIIAPTQRSLNIYLFLRKNKHFRHEMLNGLSERQVFLKIAKGEFKNRTCWDCSARGAGYGYTTNSWCLIKFFKD